MVYILIIITGIIFVVHTVLRYIDSLHMFQQNLYDTKRYWHWMFHHSHKTVPLLDIAPLVLWVLMYFYPKMQTFYFLMLTTALFYIVQSYLLYRKQQGFVKKPLVMTHRAWRLVATSILAGSAIFLYLGLEFVDDTKLKALFLIYLYIVCNLLIYLVVWIASLINMPVEHIIRRRYINEARTKIAGLQYKIDVIGITGSYGKTTTKNIVTHILNQERYALMTPASFNTPLGITKTIRESLKPIHDVFVCEMGAYKPGEIKELAELVHPKYGVVTAIGPQHLNTFKTIERIQQTKFELIEALDQTGVAVLNIDDPLIASYTITSACKKLTYSLHDARAAFFAKEIVYAHDGVGFTIVFPDKGEVAVKTNLLGEHNIYNILAATAIAYDMGISTAHIVKGIATLPQIEHRLQVKSAGQFTIIDDAFNANPVGTQKAIDVLTKMTGKRIVITPGMVELGKQEAELNEAYGAYMKDKVDVVILVGKKQTEPIYRGLSGNTSYQPTERIYIADNLQDALKRMYIEAIPGSVVLIANDLPDAYND